MQFATIADTRNDEQELKAAVHNIEAIHHYVIEQGTNTKNQLCMHHFKPNQKCFCMGCLAPRLLISITHFLP